jgi:hypothetical protein
MTPSAVLMIPLATALATAAVVPLARALAGKLGAIDHPGERKVHKTPIARLGGIAPAFVFWAATGLGFAALKDPFFQRFLGEGMQDAPTVGPKLLGILLGSLIAFATGLADDIFGSRLPVWGKAAGQITAALCVVLGGVSTSFLPHPVLNAILTVFWLVGITNAFNLLDNMDGLASGVAVIAGSVLLVNAMTSGENLIGALTLAFIGVLLGFLLDLPGRLREPLHRLRSGFHPAARPLRNQRQQFVLPDTDARASSRRAHHRHHHRGGHPAARGPAHLRGRRPPSLSYPGRPGFLPEASGASDLSDVPVLRAFRPAAA